MVANKILAIAVASALLIGGVASVSATPADVMSDESDNAPVDAPDESDVPDDTTHDVPVDDGENVSDERPGDASDHRPDHAGPGEQAENASADRSDSVGPSDGLPEQVPDHVSEIHDRISAFLSGSLSNLGEALSGLLGGDAAGGESENDEADEDDSNEADEGESDEEKEETNDGDESADDDGDESADDDDDANASYRL